MEIPKEFIRVPLVLINNSGEQRRKNNKIMWHCSQCKNYTDIPTFVKGHFDMVKIVCESKKICSTHGRLYICPHCYSIMRSDGRGDWIRIDTDYKKELIAKCDFFKGREKK